MGLRTLYILFLSTIVGCCLVSNIDTFIPDNPAISRTLSEHQTEPSKANRIEEQSAADWSYWGKIRSKDVALNNSGEKHNFVKSTLNQSLETIPPITPEELNYKSSEISIEAEGFWLTKAEKARYAIRLNLARIKSQIIQNVLDLLKASPPKPIPTQSSELEIANAFADAYIASVDHFLKTHPGAKPELGYRFEAFGLQNEVNAPWCADWAQGVLAGLNERLHPKHPINQWLRFSWAQIKRPEHNFVVIYPKGNPPLMPPQANSKTLLIIDPWKTIQPQTYFPGDPNWVGIKIPTHLGIE